MGHDERLEQAQRRMRLVAQFVSPLGIFAFFGIARATGWTDFPRGIALAAVVLLAGCGVMHVACRLIAWHAFRRQ